MYLLFLLSLFLAPLATIFAAPATPTDLKSLLGNFTGIINILIPLLFALTFLTVMWGIIKAWIMGDATSEDVEKGKRIAFIGIIVLAVMSAIWGILTLLKEGLFG